MKRLFCITAVLCLLTGCVSTATPPVTTTTVAPVTTATTTTGSGTTATTTTTRPPQTTVGGTLDVMLTPPAVSDGFAWTDEQIEQINTLLASYEGRVSVGYRDLTSGFQYLYNGTESYKAASVMKAPFCRYVLGMAEQNELDLTQTMVYTEEMFVKGTGTIKESEFGTEYSYEELVKLAIRKSDNIAFKMLREAFPPSGFRQYAKAIGITDIAGIQSVSNSNLNAQNAVTYMQDIYTYIHSDSPYGKVLEQHMLHTNYPLIRSKYPVVRKHGWMDQAYHDMAIINAPRPYILVILSDHSEGEDADREMFRDISAAIEAISGN